MSNPKRQIKVLGFKIDVVDFGYAQYFYPTWNGDMEFKVSKQGYKDLCHWLKTIIWCNRKMEEIYGVR